MKIPKYDRWISVVMVLVALCIGIPGAIMLDANKKKPVDEQNKTQVALGYTLVVVSAALFLIDFLWGVIGTMNWLKKRK